jgi:isopropylmalate/homocitrate/citramalate synthase
MKTMYDVDLGLKTEKFVSVSRLVQQLADVRVPANRCIVGENLFDIESGIIVSWLRNCGTAFPTELVPFRPELVGNTPARAVLGKGSGIDSIAFFLDRIGMQATQEQMMALLLEVKERSLRGKRLVTLDEFRDMAQAAVASRPS